METRDVTQLSAMIDSLTDFEFDEADHTTRCQLAQVYATMASVAAITKAAERIATAIETINTEPTP